MPDAPAVGDGPGGNMTRRAAVVAALLLAIACIVAVPGCAGTSRKSDELPSSPDLIVKEIDDISMDIENAEEMYKAKLTQLQMEESVALRREVNELSVELEYLRARKAALEEALEMHESGGGGS
jgi:hypothetical protein